MIEVKSPRVLKNELQLSTPRLQEDCRLSPVKISADLNYDSLCKVNITLRDDDRILRQHELVEVYNANGSIGIYRVVNRGHKVRKSRTYTLNHAFDTLNDCHIPGTDTITGSVATVLQMLLNCQSAMIGNDKYWQLGTVDCTANYSFDNQYDNVYDRMKDIAEANEGYVYTFDFSTFPWTLNFVARPDNIISEMRINRGADDIDIDDSDNEQCTKLYLSIDSRNDDRIAKTQQTVTYRTIEDSTGIAEWGVIEKAIGINTKDIGTTEADIQAWITRFFNEHRDPELSISVTGEEYALYTGEPMDHIVLGGVCRTILPEYSTIFHERVVSIKYPDLLRTPLVYTAELANKRKTAGSAIAKLNKETRRSGGRSKANSQVIQGIFKDFYSEDGYFESHLTMTANNLRTEFTTAESNMYSVIEQTTTNFEVKIARKSKVYIQWEDPNNGTNVLYEGDIWIKRANNRTWNEANAAGEKWTQNGVAWRRKYGDIQYVWKNGVWKLVKDFAVDVENEVTLEQTADGLAFIGRAVDTQGKEFNSKLEVTAREIRSDVSAANSQVYSVIRQTATNIRTQVADELNGMQTQIEQTASSITLSVSASKSELYSVIKQTATSVFSGVYDKVGDNFSTIEQTASAISTKVGKGEIASTINQTAQSVLIQASKINLDGYVTTSMLQSAFTSAQQIQTQQLGVSDSFQFGSYGVSWKSFTHHNFTVSESHNFMYKTNGVEYTTSGRILGTHSTTTIYYLGR